MTQTRPSVTGQGPELFGRGIDLLFGAADEIPRAQPADLVEPETPAPMKHHQNNMKVSASADGTSDHIATSQKVLAEPMPTRSELPASAEPLPLELGGAAPVPLELGGDGPAEPLPLELGGSTTTGALEAGGEMVEPPVVPVATQTGPIHTMVNELGEIVLTSTAPTDSPPIALEESTPSEQPQPSSGTEAQVTASPTNGSGKRKVAPPGVDVSGPAGAKAKASESELSSRLSKQELDALSKEDIREIMQRLHKSDLAALDREVDDLYEKTSHLLSGSRREATVVFEILRKVRLMLLKDPEQFAQMEYLLRQVRTRINQIEQSIEGGKRYAPRIFTYEVIWLVFLSVFALVTTVGGTTFSAWVAYLLGVTPDSERLNWAVLFLSTLAWGGIGGVTSALWSLYYHISIQRDYDPVENLWYYSQPVLGMVLGGIVFLIMGAGFLVVQVDLAGQDAALGARLMPAAVAVIAGFRQTVVLDLIERAIALIAPPKPDDVTLPPPPSEPI